MFNSPSSEEARNGFVTFAAFAFDFMFSAPRKAIPQDDETSETVEIRQKLFTKKQAAEYLEVSERTINNLMSEGKIRACYFGRNVRFTREELDHFAENLPNEPDE